MVDLKKGVLLVSSLALVILLVGMVYAAPNAPTGLTFNGNATSSYDEGEFSLNWTSGGGNAEASYTIYLFSNNSLYGTASNNSNTGYTFSNATESNYTFIVQAQNATGSKVNSTTNISIYVDSTGPTISLPVYINATYSTSSSTLSLNVYVIDSLSGTTGSTCLINVNGTNTTVAVSSGWCNTTSVPLAGLSDGNNTITVYANDTVNNLALNNSFITVIDSTNPTASASCSPSSIDSGAAFPCTCSGSDATSGVSSSAGASTSGSITNTGSTGTFIYTCTVTDNAGNIATSTSQYSVNQLSGPPKTTLKWITHSISKNAFSKGYTYSLAERNRFEVQIEGENHYIGVLNISQDSVNLEITSDPITTSLSVGESKKIDSNRDGFYDILVLLNEISGNEASLTIQEIHEESPSGDTVSPSNEGPSSSEDQGNNNWLWIIIAIIVVLVALRFSTRKRKR